jgi:hypothetical protein
MKEGIKKKPTKIIERAEKEREKDDRTEKDLIIFFFQIS